MPYTLLASSHALGLSTNKKHHARAVNTVQLLLQLPLRT
jgi:hypothetical protein